MRALFPIYGHYILVRGQDSHDRQHPLRPLGPTRHHHQGSSNRSRLESTRPRLTSKHLPILASAVRGWTPRYRTQSSAAGPCRSGHKTSPRPESEHPECDQPQTPSRPSREEVWGLMRAANGSASCCTGKPSVGWSEAAGPGQPHRNRRIRRIGRHRCRFAPRWQDRRRTHPPTSGACGCVPGAA